MKSSLSSMMKSLETKPVLVNKPKMTICKVGDYFITVSSENTLEQSDKFDSFCKEFSNVLMLMVSSQKKEIESHPSIVPTVAHEGVS